MPIREPLKTPKSTMRYERAIRATEKTFSRNKSRMWVLKMLREELDREARDEEKGS